MKHTPITLLALGMLLALCPFATWADESATYRTDGYFLNGAIPSASQSDSFQAEDTSLTWRAMPYESESFVFFASSASSSVAGGGTTEPGPSGGESPPRGGHRGQGRPGSPHPAASVSSASSRSSRSSKGRVPGGNASSSTGIMPEAPPLLPSVPAFVGRVVTSLEPFMCALPKNAIMCLMQVQAVHSSAPTQFAFSLFLLLLLVILLATLCIAQFIMIIRLQRALLRKGKRASRRAKNGRR